MSQPQTESSNNKKPTPAYLLPDYPYQAVGKEIADLEPLKSSNMLYEIKCPECGTGIRAQGDKVKYSYTRLINGNGCIVCGNKNLIINEIDMSVKG